MKLKEVIKEQIESKKYSIKERTYLFYKQQVFIHIEEEIGNIDLKEITQDVINDYIINKYKSGNKNTGKELSYSSTKLLIGIINRGLQYAYKKKYISEKLEVEVTIKNNDFKKVYALSREEQKKLEKYILEKKKTYSYGILLSLYTGMRLGELLALKWENIDFKNKVILVNKTICRVSDGSKTKLIEDTPKTQSSCREIPINNCVIALLKELKQYQQNNSEYVVSRIKGKRLETRSYQDSFSRILKKLKIKHYGFHSLRHTFATRSLEIGVDIKTLSELLGHTNPTITLNRYVHYNMDLKRNAINKLTKSIWSVGK